MKKLRRLNLYRMLSGMIFLSMVAALMVSCAGSPEIKGSFPRYFIPAQPSVHFLTHEDGFKCLTPKQQRKLGQYIFKLQTVVEKYDKAARIWNGQEE